MTVHKKSLANGEIWSLPGGSNFQILSSALRVDVEFFLNRQKFDESKNVPSSFYKKQPKIQLPVGFLLFDQVKITAAYGAVEVEVDVSGVDSGTNILSGDVNVASSGVFNTLPAVVAGVGATVLAAASSTRKELIIQNDSTVGETAYVGGAGVTVADGMQVNQGGVVIATSRAAIYAISTGGTAKLRLTET